MIAFLNEYKDTVQVTKEDGSIHTMPYPPELSSDRELLGNITKEEIEANSTKFVNEQLRLQEKWIAFQQRETLLTEAFAIEAILSSDLSKEELMKLKLSIFNHEFIKSSKNKEVLTAIRTADNAVDLVMYFGMLRKEADDNIS